MAVNKNFVVKNGLEVNSNLLIADLDSQTVGIGTTIAPHELHVVGGIGVTNLNVTGVATIANLRVTGPSTFVGVSTFVDGNVFIQKNLFVNGIDITGGSGGSIGTDLVIQRHVRAGGIVTFSDSLFVGSGLGQSTGTLGQVFQVAGVSSDAYIGGTLGIGTTNPQDLALHVVGDTRFVGVNTFQGDVVVTGNLDVTGDITYDEITGRNLNISGLATFQSLTPNRVAIVGAGDTLNDTNSLRFADNDLSQLVLGVGATVGGALTVTGAVDFNSTLDVDGLTELDDVNVSAAMTVAGAVDINGGLNANTAIVGNLNDNRVVIVGSTKNLEDDANFVFDGQQLILGVGLTVGTAITAASYSVGNNQVISSARQLQNIASLDATTTTTIESAIANAPNTFTDLQVTGIATFKSTVNVEDLTPGRVVFVGAGDSLTDNPHLLFNSHNRLIIGGGTSIGGATTIVGSLAQSGGLAAFTSNVSVNSLKITDLTDNRVVIAGASSEIEDDANFVFDGSQLILGVGATVGGALTVAGEGTFSSGVGIADSIFHIGDLDTAIRFPDANTFTVETANGERLRCAANGRVGLGTAIPREKLDIGPGRIILDQDFQLTWANGTTNRARIYGDQSNNFIVENGSSNTERLRVTSGGLVGLGTADPDVFNPNADDLVISGLGHQGLTIRSGNAHDGSIMFNDTTDANQRGIIRYDHTTDAMAFHTSGGETLRMTSGGDVGIGTTNPTANNAVDAANEAVLAVGVVTAREYYGDGSNLSGLPQSGIGIRSDSTTIGFGVTFIDFIGSGIGTCTVDTTSGIGTINVTGSGGGGGGGGVTETDTTVSTVNPTGVGSFATASFRSASVIAQINQLNTDFQVGRYLMIHDGTTVTVVEESAVSTGSTMLGSFTGVIDGSNVELRVTLASAGVSTITTKIDTVTV